MVQEVITAGWTDSQILEWFQGIGYTTDSGRVVTPAESLKELLKYKKRDRMTKDDLAICKRAEIITVVQ